MTIPRTVEFISVRRVFPRWSIDIPAEFDETYIGEDGCWHAWDEARSVSMTSVLIEDEHGPVSAVEIARRLLPVEGAGLGGRPPTDGEPVELPPGLAGWAVAGPAVEPARASRAISGILVVDGATLIATVTANDVDWARRTWLSIRHHQPPTLRGSRSSRPCRSGHRPS